MQFASDISLFLVADQVSGSVIFPLSAFWPAQAPPPVGVQVVESDFQGVTASASLTQPSGVGVPPDVMVSFSPVPVGAGRLVLRIFF